MMGAWLITELENQRYYHHLPMAVGAVYVSVRRVVFLSWSGRGRPDLPGGVSYQEIREEQLGAATARLLKADGERYLSVEERIPLNLYRYLTQAPEMEFAEVATAVSMVETLREQKTAWELEQLELACAITDHAFYVVLDYIKPGVTELEIAALLEKEMRLGGSEEPNKTIVAAGVHSAFPHHWPISYAVREGDFVTMDYGCRVNGYHSDLTRTVVVGKASERQRHIYETVLEAQLASIDILRAGKTGGEVDRVARSIIEKAGYEGAFLHNLGHGIGLSIHEGTGLIKDSDKLLKPGMVVSIEPGIYLENYGGVRIEDIAVVEADGCRVLEHSPKKLFELR